MTIRQVQAASECSLSLFDSYVRASPSYCVAQTRRGHKAKVRSPSGECKTLSRQADRELCKWPTRLPFNSSKQERLLVGKEKMLQDSWWLFKLPQPNTEALQCGEQFTKILAERFCFISDHSQPLDSCLGGGHFSAKRRTKEPT